MSSACSRRTSGVIAKSCNKVRFVTVLRVTVIIPNSCARALTFPVLRKRQVIDHVLHRRQVDVTMVTRAIHVRLPRALYHSFEQSDPPRH